MATDLSLAAEERKAIPEQEKGAGARAPATARLVSLDAFRGFTMFWIVGGSGLMLGLQGLDRNPIIDTIIHHLEHTPWQGLRYYDLIWPCFMLMVGMSLPFSYAKRSLTQSHGRMTAHAVKRAAILFLLGSVRTSVSSGSPTFIELSSALQPIAVAYLVAFLLVRNSARVQAAAAGLILAGYALLLALIPAPGIAAGTYETSANLVAAVDLAVLGRTHPEGWGTVLSTIPTVATTILGLLIGGLLMSDRPARTKAGVIAAVGAGGVVLGLAMDPVVPVIMKLWTTSYGILSAGWACLLFLLFYWVIDVRGHKKWAFPLVVIGANALAVYMSRTLIPLPRMVRIFTGGIAEALGPGGALFQAVSILVVEWLILWWMFRRKIFLSA